MPCPLTAIERSVIPPDMQRRRPHPRGDTIAYIWIGLFVAGFLGALFFEDNDPNTDDSAAWGALIFIAGGGAYRGLSCNRESLELPQCHCRRRRSQGRCWPRYEELAATQPRASRGGAQQA